MAVVQLEPGHLAFGVDDYRVAVSVAAVTEPDALADVTAGGRPGLAVVGVEVLVVRVRCSRRVRREVDQIRVALFAGVGGYGVVITDTYAPAAGGGVVDPAAGGVTCVIRLGFRLAAGAGGTAGPWKAVISPVSTSSWAIR